MGSLSEEESEQAALTARPTAPTPPVLSAPPVAHPAPTEGLEDMIRRLIAEAVTAITPPAPPASVVVDASPMDDAQGLSSEYPVVYGNPFIMDEQFYVVGSPYRQRFVKGRFVAQDAQAEVSVRACLEAHGKGFADRWKGEDRKEWTCRKTGFRTANEQVKEDYEIHNED
jgi:hypothetical protein